MPQNRIVTLVALGLVVLDMIWFLIRGIKNGFVDKEILTRAFVIKSIVVYIFALAIIVITWIREYGILGDIVICGCGVLAVEIKNRQMLGIINDDDDIDVNY